MNDERDDLLKEIGDALNVEPSPSFAAGVRTRIASEPASGRSWTAWLVWTGAAAAVTASIAILATRGRVEFSAPLPVTPPVVAKAETPVVGAPAPVPATSVPAPTRDKRLPGSGRASAPASSSSTEPLLTEPLLIVQIDPRTKLGAIWALALSATTGDVATVAPEPQAEWPAIAPLPELKELTVAPIVVAAIEIPGVVSQGGVPVIRRVADGARR